MGVFVVHRLHTLFVPSVLEMKVMVKEAKKISGNVLYPEHAKKDNEASAQIRLPQELFGKYKGSLVFLHKFSILTLVLSKNLHKFFFSQHVFASLAITSVFLFYC